MKKKEYLNQWKKYNSGGPLVTLSEVNRIIPKSKLKFKKQWFAHSQEEKAHLNPVKQQDSAVLLSVLSKSLFQTGIDSNETLWTDS